MYSYTDLNWATVSLMGAKDTGLKKATEEIRKYQIHKGYQVDIRVHSWPLNNTSLNYAGPAIYRFFQ